jgi:hypothetical protein
MDTSAGNTSEVEQTRHERAMELNAEQGADWAEGYRPGSFGCHELLDRLSLFANNLEQYVLSHPACVAHAEWYALADQAATALQELYQRIGAAHLDTDPPDEKKPLSLSGTPGFSVNETIRGA